MPSDNIARPCTRPEELTAPDRSSSGSPAAALCRTRFTCLPLATSWYLPGARQSAENVPEVALVRHGVGAEASRLRAFGTGGADPVLVGAAGSRFSCRSV